ncbi:hypothetical protein ABPG73_022670 [Tetrahymena malaccensis]
MNTQNFYYISQFLNNDNGVNYQSDSFENKQRASLENCCDNILKNEYHVYKDQQNGQITTEIRIQKRSKKNDIYISDKKISQQIEDQPQFQNIQLGDLSSKNQKSNSKEDPEKIFEQKLKQMYEIGEQIDSGGQGKFILHLDIKPQNILITQEGNCIFTDFGGSQIKILGQNTYSKIHTPYYAAYEQKRGIPVDFKTDAYSLGITLKKVIDKFIENNSNIQQNNKFSIVQNIQNYLQKYVNLPDINSRHDIYQVNQFLFDELQKQNPMKDRYLKIVVLNLKKNQAYIQQAKDNLNNLSEKNYKKIAFSYEMQRILKHKSKQEIEDQSLEKLSDQDFFEFFVKVYVKLKYQKEKLKASCEINKIEDLKQLKQNHKYITIDLAKNSQNETISTQSTNQQIEEIKESLQNQQQIKNLVLNLNKYEFDDKQANCIGSALQNFKLSKLSLGLEQNQIEKAEFLQQALPTSENMIKLKLFLKNNKINESGCQLIGLTLKKCKNLMHLQLDLEQNYLSNEGANSLFSSIEKCQDLIKLKLYLKYFILIINLKIQSQIDASQSCSY